MLCPLLRSLIMTIRERILAMADDEGNLTADQVHYLVSNVHLLPFSDYCEETAEDFSADCVLDWLGY